jgi:signal transduction histidine kinase
MIKLRSITAKSIAYTLLIMLVPALVLGSLGMLYFHGAFKENIQNDYQEEARTIAALTSNYLDRSFLFLERQAERSALINALDENNIAALDSDVEKIQSASDLYYWTFVTDASGRVLASNPYGSAVGKDLNDILNIAEPLRTGTLSAGPPMMNEVTGRKTIIVGTPIVKNGTTIGVLAGALDDGKFNEILGQMRAFVPLQSIYLVNRTGQVVYSHDKKYEGMDLSYLPVVQNVLRGEEGIDDHNNFTTEGMSIAAYSPVQKYSMGAIVAISENAAYKPINDAIAMLLPGLLALALLAALLAIAGGNYITRPIKRLSTAAEEVSKTGKIADLSKYLPYDRDDELGSLARSFKDMADRIMTAREKIGGEKKHADMYIDVMGHDINNLNQAILSHLEIIDHYDQLSPQQKECLDGAITATKDSAAIIRNVRAIQAVTMEKQALQKVDLDEVIRECIKEVQRPEDKKVTISYVPGRGRIAEAVPSIKLAFGNVLRNSIRYSGPEVHLDIAVREEIRDERKYYVTTVTDDGNGIPEETRETLFTRFRQDSTVPPGKGLGLYAAKVLAEQSGGSIGVESRVPEDYKKGTRVIISLPAAVAPED